MGEYIEIILATIDTGMGTPISRGVALLTIIFLFVIFIFFRSKLRKSILISLITLVSLSFILDMLLRFEKNYFYFISYIPVIVSIIILLSLYKHKVKAIVFYGSLLIILPVIYVFICLSSRYEFFLCYKKGGDVVHHPISSFHHDDNTICNFKYSDVGKNCQSNADCMGDCIKVPNNTDHGKCSPGTLYHSTGLHPQFLEGSYDDEKICPYSVVEGGFCDLELFNKSDQWKDYHYVK